VTQWGYNSAGLVTSMKYPGGNAGEIGEEVSYAYNSQMTLNSLFSATNSYYYVQKTAYDAEGRIEYRYLGAANLNNNPVLATNYDYYPWSVQGQGGRLWYLQSGVYTDTTNLQDFAYVYDNVGNISSIVDDNPVVGTQTQTFSYDLANRLHTGQASGGANGTYAQETYNYSSSTGNLTNSGTSLTYNAQVSCTAGNRTIPHAVSNVGTSYYYFYDCNGNMTTRQTSTITYTLDYNAENQMTGVSGGATVAFLYDGDGNRVKGTVGSTTTIYIGNYFEWSGSSTTMKKYYYAGSTRVAMRSGSTLTYLLSDHLGSTSVTANSSGALTSDLFYKPWGRTRYTYGTIPTTYRFTGQRAEISIGGAYGLYFYGARWFDPLLGRFISPDSMIPDPSNPADFDRYSYVRNNPVNFIDPSGHMSLADGDDDRYDQDLVDEYLAQHPQTSSQPSLIAQTSNLPKDTSMIAQNTRIIGNSINPGKFLGGYCGGGGKPNQFYVGGVYADDATNSFQFASATLNYSASYNLSTYENSSVLTINETYNYVPPFGLDAKGGSILNMTTYNETTKWIGLGNFSEKGSRSTNILLYGKENRPTDISIRVNFWIEKVAPWSHGFPDFTFFTPIN
jgi:RHS repeat-associated protein